MGMGSQQDEQHRTLKGHAHTCAHANTHLNKVGEGIHEGKNGKEREGKADGTEEEVLAIFGVRELLQMHVCINGEGRKREREEWRVRGREREREEGRERRD